MHSLENLFDLWPSMADLAGDIGESHWTVQKWKQRQRIPSAAWPALIEAARRKGKKLSAEQLLSMHGTTVRRASGE